MDHQIVEQVKQWLEMQNHRTLLISKEEKGDLDQVELQLSDISIGKLEENDPDGYVSPQSLLLHGQGTVVNGSKQEHLPQDVYEIPLFGTWIAQRKENQFQIRTERGVYTIQVH